MDFGRTGKLGEHYLAEKYWKNGAGGKEETARGICKAE